MLSLYAGVRAGRQDKCLLIEVIGGRVELITIFLYLLALHVDDHANLVQRLT